MEPWIKLYKKFTQWEWYTDNNVKIVFIHLLLTANWQAKKWQGMVIHPGELVTSYQNLASEIHMSVPCVRRALDKLVKTHCIERKSSNKFTLLKLVNYTQYQSPPPENEQTNGNQTADGAQSDGNQRATTKEIKNKRIKEGYIYPPYTKRKNSFQDYSDEVTDFDIRIIKERYERFKEENENEIGR